MLQAPLVSVVILTYNRSSLLLDALASVLKQTFTDFEIIIVNDGSTDDTVERLKPLRDRIRLINQANAGLGAARNRGVREARGTYVALLDDDDIWRPEKLAVQIEFSRRRPDCSLVCTPFATSADPARPVNDPAVVRNSAGIIEHPLRKIGESRLWLPPSTVIWERRRAAGLTFESRRNCIDDTPFFIKLLARGPLGMAGESPLVIYRLPATTSSTESSGAVYWYNGIRMMRSRQRGGDFDAGGESHKIDIGIHIGYIGRTAAVRQLAAGRRRRGARVYLSEFFHQLRLGRFRFLLSYPILLLLPARMIHRLTKR